MREKFSTTCSYCGVGCGINLTVDTGEVIDLEGNQEHSVNFGMLCSKGLNLHHVVNDKSDRLLYPYGRFSKSHPLRRLSWEQALQRASSVFKTVIEKFGSDSVGLYVSGQMLTEEYYLANKLCKGFFQTNNIDTNSRLCMSSAVVGYKQSLGADTVPIAYEDIEHCDCFFVAGANPAWCHPIIFRRIEAQLAKNSKNNLIVVDPRKTQTAQGADIHLQLRPGTDVQLYNVIASLLFKKGYADKEFLAKYTNGSEETRQFLEKIDIAQSVKICGVEKKDLEKTAEVIGQSKGLLTLWAMGLNQSSKGVDKNLALINLNLITGRIGKKGCGPFSLTGQPNAMGGREVGGMANLLAAHHNLDSLEDREKVAKFWNSPAISSQKGLTATEMVDAIMAGKLKALWVVCSNPLVSLPKLNKVKEAFEKIPFLMVSDISNKSDTVKYADLVLPSAGWLEKEGTMTNSERRITYLPKALSPPQEALPDTEIFCRFAKAMGFSQEFDYASAEEIFNEHKQLTRGKPIDITGVSYSKLKKNPIQWPCKEGESTGKVRLFEDKKFFTHNQKANLHAVEFKQSSEVVSQDYPFILTTGRLRDQWHTMTRTGKVQRLRLHSPRPHLEIHPQDAQDLGLGENDLVEVYNQRGSIEVSIEATDNIGRKVLFLPMHWTLSFNQGRSCSNILTSDLVDPISKEPEFKFSAVNLRKVNIKKKVIVIVGAGAATLEFVQKYRERNTSDEIIVYGKEQQNFYNRILLPEYLNDTKKWGSLTTATVESLSRQGVIFHRGVFVNKICPKRKLIFSSNGDCQKYDKLILATGSTSFIPSFFNDTKKMEGVFALRSRLDADKIRRHIKEHRTAVIVGGGLLGLELATSLTSVGVKVTIVQRSSRLMRGQLDELAGRILDKEITNRGIRVIYNAQIVKVYDKEKIRSIRLSTGEIVQCESLFFAVGVKANMQLAKEAGLKCSRAVIVNEFMQSSNEDIYAIGEVAEFQGSTYATTSAAQEQANHLVNIFLADYSKPYSGSLNFNILKIDNLNLCSLGVTSKLDDSYEEVKITDEKLGYYKKCIIKNDRLVGAILIGDKSEFSHFKKLIQGRLELGEERKTLLRSSFKSVPLEGKLVCICNNVGDGNIKRQITKGCDDFETLCLASNAGTSCGSCRPEVKKILDESLQEIAK